MTDLVGRSVTVRVPATSANLGPGFDTLGLALALYDELTVTATASGVSVDVVGVGAGEVPTDETNLVVRSIRHTFDHVGIAMPGLALEAHNVIPHGRGLGSSGAAIVSGIMAAKGLLEVTEEEWGYTVTLRNLTGAPVEGLRAEYRLFTKIDELKNSGRAPRIRRKAFALDFETLPAAGRISARTEFVTTRKTDLKGGYEWAGTGDNDTRDTLHGIWLRVYQGDELVLESASPSGLATGRWEDNEG
jgi:hypothetical protein